MDPAGIDTAALRTYLASVFPDGGDAIQVALIPGGRSNLTFDVHYGDHRCIVRRPPLGHVLTTAHDMGREARVLRALAPTAVPVPEVIAYCDDPAVIGTPFLVMSFVSGDVLGTPDLITTLGTERATRITDSLLTTLIALHAVTPSEVGLTDFGKPDGFLERQVRRWSEQLAASRTREIPTLDEVTRRLTRAAPVAGAHSDSTIVHGDYRLDNTVVNEDGAVVGVLDWEMATYGDPLTDLALLCCYSGGVAAELVPTAAAIARRPDLLDRTTVLTEYVARSERSLEHFAFYEALAHYKLAIIAEGIHARYTLGLTVGDGFETIGTVVPRIADAALALTDDLPQ